MKIKIKKFLISMLICFSGVNFITFAESNNLPSNSINLKSDLVGTVSTLQGTANVFYVMLRPLLVLADKFMKNDLIFGHTFHIDGALRKLWQSSRMIVNYFLAFLFLISIFVYFVKPSAKISFPKIRHKLVLSGILVNFSWFLIGALLDISTILIYFFSSLPGKFDNNIKFSQLPVYVDLNKKPPEIGVKCQNKKYVPCVFPIDKGKVASTPSNKENCFAFDKGDSLILYDYDSNSRKFSKNNGSSCIKKISSSMIFSPLMNFLSLSFFSISSKSVMHDVVVVFVKLLIFIMLVLPIIVLVVILFIRIFLLWIYIPFSPFILSSYILTFPKDFSEKFSELINLIFQPVVVIIALSLSFILLSALQRVVPLEKSSSTNVFNQIGIKLDKNKISLFGFEYEKEGQIPQIGGKGSNNVEWSPLNILQYIKWIIVNLIGGFILWSAVFAALKASKIKIISRIAGTVQEGAAAYAKSIRVIPLFGKRYGVGAIVPGITQAMEQYPQSLINSSYTDLKNKLSGMGGKNKKGGSGTSSGSKPKK